MSKRKIIGSFQGGRLYTLPSSSYSFKSKQEERQRKYIKKCKKRRRKRFWKDLKNRIFDFIFKI